MSTFKQHDGEGYTDFVLYDHGIKRGWFRLDRTDGSFQFTPGSLGTIWVAPEDGEPYKAIREHLLEQRPVEPKPFSLTSPNAGADGLDEIFGTAAERKEAYKVMAR